MDTGNARHGYMMIMAMKSWSMKLMAVIRSIPLIFTKRSEVIDALSSALRHLILKGQQGKDPMTEFKRNQFGTRSAVTIPRLITTPKVVSMVILAGTIAVVIIWLMTVR